MLRPAILYKDEIIRKFREQFYTRDMMYVCGDIDNWSPDIVECPDEFTFQFAVVNEHNNCIGFIGFKIDWYSSYANRFAIMSFDKGNILFGKALKEIIYMLVYDFKLHKIEWGMISGNPVEKSYDKFCKKYNGNKYIFHDSIKDKRGNYHDRIIYEVIVNP